MTLGRRYGGYYRDRRDPVINRMTIPRHASKAEDKSPAVAGNTDRTTTKCYYNYLSSIFLVLPACRYI